MLTSQIFILSQPIQTGKTTLLQEWISGKSNIGGMLTPDVHGVRKLLDVSSGKLHNLQLSEHEEGINIGRFVFDPDGFAKARQLLTDALHKKFDWLIVDEIGRLELDRNQGLEPTLSEVIGYFKTYQTQTKLLLVVRDYLLEDVKQHYQIQGASVLNRDFFLTAERAEEERRGAQGNITGVVLCGGQSVRMGHDKAFLKYHSSEQYAHVAEMMKPFCDAIFISSNQQQKKLIDQSYKSVTDNATFADAGPMTGVLSVFEHIHHQAILLVGCDYPYFSKADISALIDARDPAYDVVCYHNPESGFDEPLLAVYEKQCAPLLLNCFKKGHTSLRHFLQTVRTKRIHPVTLLSLTSIDEPGQYK